MRDLIHLSSAIVHSFGRGSRSGHVAIPLRTGKTVAAPGAILVSEETARLLCRERGEVGKKEVLLSHAGLPLFSRIAPFDASANHRHAHG